MSDLEAFGYSETVEATRVLRVELNRCVSPDTLEVGVVLILHLADESRFTTVLTPDTAESVGRDLEAFAVHARAHSLHPG